MYNFNFKNIKDSVNLNRIKVDVSFLTFICSAYKIERILKQLTIAPLPLIFLPLLVVHCLPLDEYPLLSEVKLVSDLELMLLKFNILKHRFFNHKIKLIREMDIILSSKISTQTCYQKHD